MASITCITILLLICSNLLMTYAWYGHLKTMEGNALWQVILVSWLIAGVEYCFMIPANRIGSRALALDQLKIIQEALSLLVFIPFSVYYMKNQVSWNYLAACGCIIAAVFFIFAKK